MPRRKPTSSRSGFWRILAIAAAAALGVAAICLVVFSSSAKQIQIGVLLGAWAAFLAAPVIFGSRRSQLAEASANAPDAQTADAHASELQAARRQVADLRAAQLEATRDVHQVHELELRRFGELELARETAERREADYRLELALRGEMEKVLGDQIGVLREEISSLRAEVVDKLGGQLRLERIETTRVIASDLEALQNEIKRLGSAKIVPPAAQLPVPPPPVPPAQSAPPVPSAPAMPQSMPAMPSVPPAPSPMPTMPPLTAARMSPQQSRPEIIDAELVDSPVAAAPAVPARVPDYGRDPFANLPRLTPLSQDVAELLEKDEPAPPRKLAKGERDQAADKARRSGKRRAPDSQPEDPRYAGRRRAASDHAAAERAAGGHRRAPASAD